jgi:hypothetical protein
MAALDNYQPRVCDCCFILEGDQRLKWCLYCGICRAWLCDHCRSNWMRRWQAALGVQTLANFF